MRATSRYVLLCFQDLYSIINCVIKYNLGFARARLGDSKRGLNI